MATARAVVEWGRRISRILPYRKLTIAVCALNLIAAVFVLASLYSSLSPPRPSADSLSAKYSEEQTGRIQEAGRVREAAEPRKLGSLVKKLRRELKGEKWRWELSDSVKQRMGAEILGRLREINETGHRVALELWRIEKLEEINTHANLTSDSNIPAQESKMLKHALKFDWLRLLEEIGYWMPTNVNNTETDDKPENAQELEEEEIIPGQPMPPECHVELHTDYGGTAVRWGLTHHKESAADCCQACLDQAKNAKPGEKKCNIWVYCPSEFGCYSPDIYEHKHQECWLKQADKPQLNFKDRYSESYRNAHPTAPIVVPWMSGVVDA